MNLEAERAKWDYWFRLIRRDVFRKLDTFDEEIVRDGVQQACLGTWLWHCDQRQKGRYGIQGAEQWAKILVTCAPWRLAYAGNAEGGRRRGT